MRVRTLMYISWKNLWAHRMRTILTVGGVSIGVAAIVFLVSLGFGLEQLVTSQVANFEAFRIIDIPSANLKSGKINDQALDKIRQVPHVSQIERIVDLAGRGRLKGQNSTTETVVVGVQPSYFHLADSSLTTGRFFAADKKDEVVINQSLANLLGFEKNSQDVVGKTFELDLIVPKDLRQKDEKDGPLVKEGIPLTIVGVTPDASNPSMSVPLDMVVQQGVVNYTSLKIQIDDRNAAPEVRKQIENIGFFTEYVGDTVSQITQVFAIFRLILGGFGMIALLVAALGTFNTLTISLIERIREVSLMKMLGMKRFDVFKLFISESLTIGLMGGVIGSLFGYGVGILGNLVVSSLASRSSADVVTIFYTPPIFLLVIFVGSVVVGFFTGFYPSYRAIKTDPLDALRYE